MDPWTYRGRVRGQQSHPVLRCGGALQDLGHYRSTCWGCKLNETYEKHIKLYKLYNTCETYNISIFCVLLMVLENWISTRISTRINQTQSWRSNVFDSNFSSPSRWMLSNRLRPGQKHCARCAHCGWYMLIPLLETLELKLFKSVISHASGVATLLASNHTI